MSNQSITSVAPKRGRVEGSVFRFTVNGAALNNGLMVEAMDFKKNPLPTINDLIFKSVPDEPTKKEKKNPEVYMQDLMAFMAECKSENRVPTPAECEALWFIENKAVNKEFNLEQAIAHEGEFDVTLTELYRPLNALIESINQRKSQIKALWTQAHEDYRRQKLNAKAAASAAASK
jgi:hypothetical protein